MKNLQLAETANLVDTQFGKRYSLPQVDGCKLAVICRNNGSGLQPYRICLPHQIYMKTIETMLALHPNTKSIAILLAASSATIATIEVADSK